MAQLGPIGRYLIKLLFGTALMMGTFPEALVHFQTAQQLCPERAIHRVEVGRSLMKVWFAFARVCVCVGALYRSVWSSQVRLSCITC